MESLSGLETLIIVQIGIEIILILFAIVLVLRFRKGRLGQLGNRIEDIVNLINETEKVCKMLAANLKEKRALADRVLCDMDCRIKELHKLTNKPVKPSGCHLSTSRNQSVGPYTNVVELSRHGLSINEIAERLSLTKGEVELVLGLAKEGQEIPGSLAVSALIQARR